MILHWQWIAAIFFFYSYFYNQRKYKVVKSAVKLDPRQTHQSAISWPFQHHVFLPWNVKYLHYYVRLPSLLYKHEKRHIILKKLDYFWNFSVHLMIPFRKISFYFGKSGGRQYDYCTSKCSTQTKRVQHCAYCGTISTSGLLLSVFVSEKPWVSAIKKLTNEQREKFLL